MDSGTPSAEQRREIFSSSHGTHHDANCNKQPDCSCLDKNEERRQQAEVSRAPGDPHPVATMRPLSPLKPLNVGRCSTSPNRARHPYMVPASPGRPFPSSPRLHSPASSQIFERSVQEDIGPAQASPSIPSHIVTENHIPPILDASSVALTNERLDPDSVEIVTHNYHQPASLAVAGGSQYEHSMTSSWNEDAGPQPLPDTEDSASNYGALDSTDVRRLSFVSFADVVHGEHAETADPISANRDSFHLGGLSTVPAALMALNRSPSPVRSPVSSHGRGTSPPTSVSPESRDLNASPHRKGRMPGSPQLCSHSPPPGAFGGELNVETMRQALRRTESGDLGGMRSQPMSAIGDGPSNHPFK